MPRELVDLGEERLQHSVVGDDLLSSDLGVAEEGEEGAASERYDLVRFIVRGTLHSKGSSQTLHHR